MAGSSPFSPASGTHGAAGAVETAPIQPTGKSRGQLESSIRWIGSDGRHRVSPLRDAEVVVGRDESCDVVLSGGGTSRRHCAIARTSRGLEARDLGSRNGVFVDGKSIQASTPLAPGSVLRVGDWVGVVVEGDATFADAVVRGAWGSHALTATLRDAREVARAGLWILILGETGTGKELVAAAVKEWAGRSGKFVPVNCAALPEQLAESELFGHHAGAFTGAVKSRAGHLQESSGGVLFLDEVGELAPSVQAKLLRALQERKVTPVGSSTPLEVDLCVVAATHRDLRQMVHAGGFRQDLLTRLEGLSVHLPPLRERRGDIWPLFERFVQAVRPRRMPEVSARFVETVVSHHWPGNVRELKQAAERIAVLEGTAARWDTTYLQFLHSVESEPSRRSVEPPPARYSRRNPPSLDQFTAALLAAGGVRERAARSLGLSKNTFLAIAGDLGVDLDAYRRR